MSANLLDGECRYECAKTWRYKHGDSLPDGPFPGTLAERGDVRRCEHGQVWLFAGVRKDAFFNDFDHWRRVSRLTEPLGRIRRLPVISWALKGTPLTGPAASPPQCMITLLIAGAP